jgi:predicted Zn-dependent peptidase
MIIILKSRDDYREKLFKDCPIGKRGATMSEKLYVTKNGIKIYSYRNENAHSFFVSMYLRAGSMFEREEDSGITHFLEHVAIRNVNALMGDKLYALLDKYGLSFNASTASEMVQFYVSGSPKNFAMGAGILASVLSPIVLGKDSISVERERIKAEIREADEKNTLAAFANSIAFEDTSLSRSILGTNKTVGRITGARLERYRREVMTTGNIFFYVTGCFTDEDIEALAREIEAKDVPFGDESENVAPIPSAFCKRVPEVHIKNGDFTMLRLTFDIDMSRVHPQALDIIYDMLVSGNNSRLFYELSETRGIVYDINGFVDKYKNLGILAFYYEVKEDKLYEALELTLSILTSVKSEIPDADSCMKAIYVDNAPMLLDDPCELNFTFGHGNHIVGQNFKSIADQQEAYDAITPEMLRDTMRTIFAPENLTVAVKGKKRKIDKERLDKILAEYK